MGIIQILLLPVQLKPSPEYPSGHSHLKLPMEFVQLASESHGFLRHSLSSKMNLKISFRLLKKIATLLFVRTTHCLCTAMKFISETIL